VLACSVIHASAMMADGWASALSVAGVRCGMALAERHRLPVRWVLDDGSEALSPALAAMLAG
jgi:thiamine biosynthesis lipoprotein